MLDDVRQVSVSLVRGVDNTNFVRVLPGVIMYGVLSDGLRVNFGL